MELIIGILVSGLAEILKRLTKSNEILTLALVAILAIIGSISYSFLVDIDWWDKIVPILTTAGAFYAFILRRFVK